MQRAASRSAISCSQKYPPSALELLKIQGLGPKSIALLFEHFRVSTIDDLERICKEQKLRELPRMGAKLEEKVLRSIAQYRQSAGRFLLSFGHRAAAELIEYLKQTPGARKDHAGGQPAARQGDHRRSRPAGDRTGSGRRRSTALPSIRGCMRCSARASNKASVRFGLEGLQVDLRALPHESYGAALQYFTGSKEHNVTCAQPRSEAGPDAE